MSNSIKPGVGMTCWFWPMGSPGFVADARQPFNATIVFVRNDEAVNLSYLDHAGGVYAVQNIRITDDYGAGQAQWPTYLLPVRQPEYAEGWAAPFTTPVTTIEHVKPLSAGVTGLVPPLT